MRFGKIRILDASWSLGKNMRDEFVEKRIPTSQFFDIDEIAGIYAL